MPRSDLIYQHHDWQPLGLVDTVRTVSLQRGQEDPGIPVGAGQLQKKVTAYVNHGRWVADCGTEGCGGALCVDRDEPFFYCWVCENHWANGKWAEVEFPDAADEIEQVLLRRPAPNGWEALHRNWLPTETLAMLEAENAANGIA